MYFGLVVEVFCGVVGDVEGDFVEGGFVVEVGGEVGFDEGDEGWVGG